jgi:hypothetical protein
VKPSGSQFQCLLCGHHFAGPHSFARHRADLECLSPDEMQSAGMALNASDFWTIDAPRSIDNRTHPQEVSA